MICPQRMTEYGQARLNAYWRASNFFRPASPSNWSTAKLMKMSLLGRPTICSLAGTSLAGESQSENLLVSYYGRHPKKPQADTVLQHARMYGYRRKDIGLLRLFLPRELHVVFRAINKMERGLRELIARNSSEEFRGVYVESGLSATRKNILAPGSVGVYSGGSNYNPAQIFRDEFREAVYSKD